jgi:succinate---hydroxymethylglutarate CoA-transferase
MALKGVTILDLTRVLAGPFCTQLMGDYGAKVIKIERPGGGDETRTWGPPFVNGDAVYFLSVNRQKESVCVDMKQRRGRQIIRDLAAQCDVVVHNFVPGKEASLGVDYDTLKSVNKSLVYCSLSGFGNAEGPYRQRPAYDVVVSGIAGLLASTGDAQRVAKPGVAVTDILTGLLASSAIGAALFERERNGGRGQRVDASLFETQLACMANLSANWLVAAKDSQRWGTAHESIVPYQAFRSNDSPHADDIVFGALNDEQFSRLCRALFDDGDAAGDPRFATNALRVEHRAELVDIVQRQCSKLSRAALLGRLQDASLPCGPVNSMAEALQDEHAAAIGMVARTLPHPKHGELPHVRCPVTFSEHSPAPRSKPPPLLGEHTRSVLANMLNYSDEHIDHLYKNRIVE